MFRVLCKSKIHRATVTDKNIAYEGSITIDRTLMDCADIIPFEQVQVVNVNNGERFETYVIEGKAGTGEVCINGAAARLCEVGDNVIIIAYAMYSPEEITQFTPRIVLVDKHNQPINKR